MGIDIDKTEFGPRDFVDFENTPKPMDIALTALFAITIVTLRFFTGDCVLISPELSDVQ